MRSEAPPKGGFIFHPLGGLEGVFFYFRGSLAVLY